MSMSQQSWADAGAGSYRSSFRLLLVTLATLIAVVAARFPESISCEANSCESQGFPVAPAAAEAAEPAREAPVHGMTVSCPRDGSSWGSDAMVECLKDLKSIGVNWVAIHPYGHIERDGSIRPYYGRSRADSVPSYVTRPIVEAHKLGMKIMVKPHISYWGSFEWRGAIRFESEAQWTRFFEDYEKWILPLAEACQNADAFVVGTELEGTTHREAEWRQVITGVRSRYTGPITYAANWSDHHKVGFWDVVDVIGLQAYFPLTATEISAGDATDEVLRWGWQRIMKEVRQLQARSGKKVVFTELGYTRSRRAHIEPWKPDHTERETGGVAESLQRRCLQAALSAVDAEPSVVGAFLWKWFPGGRSPRDFDKSTPAMRQVITERWGESVEKK